MLSVSREDKERRILCEPLVGDSWSNSLSKICLLVSERLSFNLPNNAELTGKDLSSSAMYDASPRVSL